ncbi:MAG: 1-acyl-sn-glycerol-3-phosphate acyltransferase [Candidatus Rokubacteria bacterium]|nr:1-acyl-sn-glycerol-3-phosphate acyltransferase [Candidatus Rokubacteria bacterium]
MDRARPDRVDGFYAAVRTVARFWLWFFFKRVDVRHPERVPDAGAVLLCINHPNNLIDSLLVGAVLRRKVHYMATASLFRNALVARFLRACGVIPVYRKADDPDKMDRNVDAFAACFAAFDEGRLIAIYPEGTTHAEARVQRIKTGAARIALGYEARQPERLTVVPVGLTFAARKSFGSRVLVSFGPPVPVAAYRAAFAEDPVKAVDELTTAIQRAMEREVVHVERIEAAALVRAVEEIYRGELERALAEERGLAPRQIDPVRLSRAIVGAVEHFKTREPERVERLWQQIQGYRAMLAAWRVRDEAVRAHLERRPVRRRALRSWRAVIGFPFFAYGAAVNALPYYVPRSLARRLARKETDYATIRLLASILALPVFWALETWLVWYVAGAGWAALFALSLPVTGTIAYAYRAGVGRLRRNARLSVLLLTRGPEARRLLAEREAIVAELDRARRDWLTATKGSSF